MNKTVGRIGAAVTGLGVLLFAISLIMGLFFNTLFASCLICMFIAIGFIPFMVSLFSFNESKDTKAAGLSGIAFAIIYVVLIFLVYYAECTTIRLNQNLSQETLSIISYSYIGSLFFNYDLLGYGFMGLSTFFIGFTIIPQDNVDKILRRLLWIHGVFFLSCFIVPIFPVFVAGTSDVPGTILLLVWCAYFLPICLLGYGYINNQS